jgi:hypothetical protein
MGWSFSVSYSCPPFLFYPLLFPLIFFSFVVSWHWVAVGYLLEQRQDWSAWKGTPTCILDPGRSQRACGPLRAYSRGTGPTLDSKHGMGGSRR